MKITYVPQRFNSSSLKIIDSANKIIEEYSEQGYSLTLRQLYYQFVSRDLIANKQSEYKRMGSVINNARLAGLIDWTAIEDRTRSLKALEHWDDPSSIIQDCVGWFQLDRWEGQDNRVEVWIEKDALIGVIEKVCQTYDVPYFSCRGYTSQSEMWNASQRHLRHESNGQRVGVIHLGDHDPSGMDMTRDVDDRLDIFKTDTTINRIALNAPQVRKYNPPPNPTKLSDSRSGPYIKKYGKDSWELDALEPKVITALIKKHILQYLDVEQYDKMARKERRYQSELQEISDKY